MSKKCDRIEGEDNAAHATKRTKSSRRAGLDHYKRLTSSYHDAWFYHQDSPYERWQLKHILDVFAPACDAAECRIADVGGGTGRFADLLFRELKLKHKVLCVDNSAAMLSKVPEDTVKPVHEDAVRFALHAPPNSYDRVLLKEVVHHVESHDALREMFSGLRGCLRVGGICLIVTRPSTEIDYPFFDKAKTVWIAHQPKASFYTSIMTAAGFGNVKVEMHDFPVTMPLSQWTGMVANRMWSTFAEEHFSEDELLEGLREIEAKYKKDGEDAVSFNERMVFIRGYAM